MPERYVLSSIVQRELKARNLTADEVIREALNIKLEGFTAGDKHFPEGTVFIAWYKNKALSAVATKGMLEVEGKQYTSLSGAAAHYTGRPTTNGWDFWSVRVPGANEFIPAHKAA
jgi:hypothetical protein